jgi:hypothetical protein
LKERKLVHTVEDKQKNQKPTTTMSCGKNNIIYGQNKEINYLENIYISDFEENELGFQV